MKNNPFSLSFGKEPVSLINRNVQSYEIIDTFEDENPTYQGCVDNCDFKGEDRLKEQHMIKE